jgi:hypothetical protein
MSFGEEKRGMRVFAAHWKQPMQASRLLVLVLLPLPLMTAGSLAATIHLPQQHSWLI